MDGEGRGDGEVDGGDAPGTHGPRGDVFDLGAGGDRRTGVERLVEEPVEVREGVEGFVEEGGHGHDG